MSAWNDLSEKDKLDWLRARLAKVENELGSLSQLVGEIGHTVKEIEKKQNEKK